MVIPVVVVPGGIVTTIVGVDVGITERALRPLEIGTPIGIAERSVWRRFVDVGARNISFSRLSWRGRDCSRHYRENAEQGVAGLAHSSFRWIQSCACGPRSSTSNEATQLRPPWPRSPFVCTAP